MGMTSDHTAIQVRGLGKKYQIGGPQEKYLTFRDAITNSIKAPFKRFSSQGATPEFWALKDVSFDVERGEVVGIIGRNGAGKSTLLKILSRITTPTEGTVDLYGRVGSLLEVGTGFHTELTGRENIFLSGSILGMKRREIEDKLDEIVKFSEIEKFIDTPVKRYSSGMYVRLAFAVAAHLESEILIIDEVLAVGDMAFQKKCLGKMGEVSKNEGRTVLFVSHNMSAVEKLCDSGIILEKGEGFPKTDVTEAITEYSRQINEIHNISFPLTVGDVTVFNFEILQNGYNLTEFDGGSHINVNIEFEIKQDLMHFRIGIFIKSVTGDLICRSLIADWDENLTFLKKGRYNIRCSIPPDFLVAGEYYIQVHCSRYGITDYLLENYLNKAVLVKPPIRFNPGYIGEKPFGLVFLNSPWHIDREG